MFELPHSRITLAERINNIFRYLLSHSSEIIHMLFRYARYLTIPQSFTCTHYGKGRQRIGLLWESMRATCRSVACVVRIEWSIIECDWDSGGTEPSSCGVSMVSELTAIPAMTAPGSAMLCSVVLCVSWCLGSRRVKRLIFRAWLKHSSRSRS